MCVFTTLKKHISHKQKVKIRYRISNFTNLEKHIFAHIKNKNESSMYVFTTLAKQISHKSKIKNKNKISNFKFTNFRKTYFYTYQK